ncbi:hypothetical protein ABZ805_21930 [Saccharopolyspora sp. NPDC047091]|uniref:hypothetical protein n=1 Tax=Saccharopolyspora sp. NPDC047091 TaxID=3155924 RepID=UPI0033E66184
MPAPARTTEVRGRGHPAHGGPGARITGGGVLPGTAPGLGIEVDREVLGAPIATWVD